MPRLAISYCVHDDCYYLAQSLASFSSAGEVFVFVSRVPWSQQPGDWQTAAQIAQDAGATVVLGDWNEEDFHRRSALAHLRELGYTHVLTPDGDEIVEPALLDHLVRLAHAELADRVYIHWNTYWKSPEYVIQPREPFTPLLLLDLRHARHVHIREYEGGRPLLLGPEYGIVHHLSYVGPEERIQRKLATWGHKDEIVPGWRENVWRAWEQNRSLRDLHPTHPSAYQRAERILVPEILQPALARYRELTGTPPETDAFARPAAWSSVSIVLPLHGGRDDLRLCLDSLAACRDLWSEVLVVDNASPDDAPLEAQGREGVRLLRRETNAGFAAACNLGAAEASGSILLFLNSDTVVARPGLFRLIEALRASGSIGASGPYSNFVGHFQRVPTTYGSLETMPLFAEDFAQRHVPDLDTDMLVGFCLAVRRSVWEEVGGFDERFGLGTFEDNDFCYRLRRAGYRLVLAGRSFIHHHGSRTFQRLNASVQTLLQQNEARYRQKWRDDLECGYASHLAGLPPPQDALEEASPLPRIRFRPERHPDLRARQTAELARRADLSLCMIVKNEARVLQDCLQSAKPFFREMIVVDTGSTDRTKEIALACGATVYDYPWTDSFADARNQSLQRAQGKWVFWMDADDTLPWACGEALLQAALQAPPEVVGYIVPVQFVDDGSTTGQTRVDHLKLFRNLPGVQFEGRIHEQVLPSLRATGGQVARCEAYVLHSGYDTSPEGQARKRERDFHLLALDLAERPDHPFVLFNLGMTCHYTEQHEEAISWLQQCLTVSPPTDSTVRKAYALLALSQKALGRSAAAWETAQEGLRVVPGDPELHFHAGNLLTELGRYAEAEGHYRQTLDADLSAHFSSVDMGILGFKTYHNLGNLSLLQENYPAAKDWWRRAIQDAPAFLPSVFALFDAALERQDAPTAQEMLARVQEAQGVSPSWVEMGVRFHEALGGAEQGDVFLRHALTQEPEAVAPRLTWARRLLQSERVSEATPHLRALAEAGVAEAAYYLGVQATRQGEWERALAWMERALVLNPDHAETRAQVESLRRALGVAAGPHGVALSLEAALRQVASDFGLDAAELLAYAQEDRVGGYAPPETIEPERVSNGRRSEDVPNAENGRTPAFSSESPADSEETPVETTRSASSLPNPEDDPLAERTPPAELALTAPLRRWPGGSVWQAEGQLLYALTRALRPEVLVEIGSLVGCSASHLAAACAKNGVGKVYAVDPNLDFRQVDAALLPYLIPVKEDALAWTPPERIDLLFEDGTHAPGFTRRVLVS